MNSSSSAATDLSAPPEVDAPATIADISYRNYDGELRTRALRWWTISLATIRANVNRKRYGYWIPAGIIFMVFFFLGVSHYLTQAVRQQMEAMNPLIGPPTYNPYAVTLCRGVTWTNRLVFIATLTVGAGAVAADNRANALLVYLSKPITRADYLLGKWTGIFLLLAALTLAPSLLIFLFFAITYASDGFLRENPTLILRLLAASLAPAALNASLILGFSAWSKSPRLAGALYAAFYFIGIALAFILGHALAAKDDATGTPSQAVAVVSNVSVEGVVDGITLNLYDVTPQQSADAFRQGRRLRRRQRGLPDPGAPAVPPPPAPERPPLSAMLLIGGVLVLVPLAAAAAKVRAVEVVRG